MKKKNVAQIICVGFIAVSLLSACGKEKVSDAVIEESNVAVENENETEADESEKLSDAEDNKLSEAEKETAKEINNASNLDEELWAEVLNANYKYIATTTNESEPESLEYISTGIMEIVQFGGGDSLDSIGYTFMDLNGDGVNELLIGDMHDNRYDFKNTVLSGYTLVDGKVHMIIEGWARNAFYLLDDNSFYNFGSSGAAYSMLTNYILEKNKTELTCLDCYFTDFTDDSDMSYVSVFHNKTGEWDKNKSELLDIPSEDVWQFDEEYTNRAVIIDYTPFDRYTYTGEDLGPNGIADKPVYVRYYKDAKADIQTFYTLNIDEGPLVDRVVFETEADVSKVKILALTYEDIDDSGDVVFTANVVKEYDYLAANKAIIVKMNMPEVVPFYGISYVTSDGKEITQGVSVSGEDGSVFLSDITIK